MSAINVYLTSFADNSIQLAAQTIIEHADESSLPILTNTIVLIPQNNVAAELRYYLLLAAQNKKHNALLGPQIVSLQQWLEAHQPNQLDVISATTQELILVEALQKHQGMFESVNPWVYAHSLLELFQSLTANNINLPKNENDFIQQLTLAYGISQQDSQFSLDALSQEAHFVYTLWNAWHQQLDAYQVVDTTTAQLLSMQQSIQTLSESKPLNIYFLGYERLTKTEIQWIEQLSQEHNIYYFLQGNIDNINSSNDYHPSKHTVSCISQFNNAEVNNISNSSNTVLNIEKLNFISSTYAIDSMPLLQRAQQYNVTNQSPLKNIHRYSANDNEQEARAVDIQIRRWLLEGKTKLAIVTENRRLARRVRALLERSGVHLQDAAGWALSTTRAAATIERWLECIENDFNYLSLLDLLKSSFIFPDISQQDLQYAVYRFEQDIVRHENIPQNLNKFLQGIKNREGNLPHWFNETYEVLEEILNRLELAAKPLQALLTNKPFTPNAFITNISTSLKSLGLFSTMEVDAAGIKIINLFDNLSIESSITQLTFDWTEARAWLAIQLERSRFMPDASATQVQLIGLSQSTLQYFDGLVIAAVEDEFLPGSPNPSAFFNDAVKHELGLDTSLDNKNERFYHFTRLLNSSEHILLSYRNQGETGEPIKPSAWLALLEQFHLLVFKQTLEDSELNKLVNAAENTFTHQAEIPATTVIQPSPVVPEKIIPTRISASQYQALINCPYLYFAARCLKLEATDEIRQALSKADYGERIHQALEAFHFNKAELPGPFKAKITEQNRTAAEKVLSDIVQHIFSDDLIGNHEHQAWYAQAKKMIPHYIEWQLEQNKEWAIDKAEQNISTELTIDNITTPLTLNGRLDRIDRNINDKQSLDIIDYKTGMISSNKDVESGEQVQLPFYHSLLQNEQAKVSQVEYLEIKNDSVKSKVKLSNEKLETIAQQSNERLKEIFSQLHNENGLPAWGDETTCKRCDMQGICRKQMWQDLV